MPLKAVSAAKSLVALKSSALSKTRESLATGAVLLSQLAEVVHLSSGPAPLQVWVAADAPAAVASTAAQAVDRILRKDFASRTAFICSSARKCHDQTTN